MRNKWCCYSLGINNDEYRVTINKLIHAGLDEAKLEFSFRQASGKVKESAGWVYTCRERSGLEISTYESVAYRKILKVSKFGWVHQWEWMLIDTRRGTWNVGLP